MKVLSLFSGIGAFEKALTNMEINYELAGFSEIDKYAITSYCAIHNVEESKNLGDVSKVDIENIPNCDLVTYGFPCQDISIAGHQKGIIKGETRSGLLYEALRIIKDKKPKYAIAENVKNLVGKKFKDDFEGLLKELDDLGYNSYWQVLNAKDYGVPQNRERVFVVSIRKDVDNGKFEFPQPFDSELRLKDLLENEVDEKYYINKPYKLISRKENNSVCKQIAKVELNGHDYLKRVYDENYCSPTLPTGTGGNHEPKILELGYFPYPNSDKKHQSNTFYSAEGLSQTLDTCQGGNRQMKILEDFYKNRPTREYTEYSPSLRAERQGLKIDNGSRVRKLTPLEYWRLMGFDDKDFYKAKETGMSNTQLYKQAGNSIVVNVIEEIYKILFKDYIKQL